MNNPLLIPADEGFTVVEAARFWGVSTKTIRRRCEEFPGISRQGGGTKPRIISKPMLALLMHNKLTGLGEMLIGNFAHEDVVWAYDLNGLPPPATI